MCIRDRDIEEQTSVEKTIAVNTGDTVPDKNYEVGVLKANPEKVTLSLIHILDYQLDELELAYAITIHKAQGSEYPAVIIPLLGGPKMLMNRNLLYTAVTRARKCVTLVGDEKTFEEMENNRMEQSRYTTLDLRIKETY